MKPTRTKHIVGIVAGALLLIISPVVARLLYLSGMRRAYDTLGRGPGIADPSRLSGDISVVLYACAGGLVGSLVGLVILVLSIILLIRAGRRVSTSKPISNATGNA